MPEATQLVGGRAIPWLLPGAHPLASTRAHTLLAHPPTPQLSLTLLSVTGHCGAEFCRDPLQVSVPALPSSCWAHLAQGARLLHGVSSSRGCRGGFTQGLTRALPLQISSLRFCGKGFIITRAAAAGVSGPSPRPLEGLGRNAGKGNDQDHLNVCQVPLLTTV